MSPGVFPGQRSTTMGSAAPAAHMKQTNPSSEPQTRLYLNSAIHLTAKNTESTKSEPGGEMIKRKEFTPKVNLQRGGFSLCALCVLCGSTAELRLNLKNSVEPTKNTGRRFSSTLHANV